MINYQLSNYKYLLAVLEPASRNGCPNAFVTWNLTKQQLSGSSFCKKQNSSRDYSSRKIIEIINK